jgi:hypothetical protein
MTQLMLPFTNYQAVSTVWKRAANFGSKKMPAES